MIAKITNVVGEHFINDLPKKIIDELVNKLEEYDAARLKLNTKQEV